MASERLPPSARDLAWGVALLALLPFAAEAQRDPILGRPSVPVGLAASAGGAFGLLAGYALGRWASERFGIDRQGDDPGLTVALAGGAILSLVGTSAGSHVLGRMVEPDRRVGFGRRLRDGAMGLILGLGLGYLGSRLADPDAPDAGWVIGISLGEGAYAGLSNGRW